MRHTVEAHYETISIVRPNHTVLQDRNILIMPESKPRFHQVRVMVAKRSSQVVIATVYVGFMKKNAEKRRLDFSLVNYSYFLFCLLKPLKRESKPFYD